jgi:Zn-finger protein
MDNLTKICIEKRVQIILEEFNYQKRKKEHLEECPCNGSSPCHNIEDLNCFFCYCPWYDLEKLEGGCKKNNPLKKGKWFEREGHSESDRIWDCSNCTYPHEEKVIKDVLTRLFYGKLEI